MNKRHMHTVLPSVLLAISAPLLASGDPLILPDRGRVKLPSELKGEPQISAYTNYRTPGESLPPSLPASPMQTAVISADQASFEQLFIAANQAVKANNLSQAIELYRRAIEKNSGHAEPYFNLAIALITQDKKEDAIGALEGAIQRNPSYTKAYLYLGRTLNQLKRGKEALPHFQKAAALDPTHWEAHAAIGRELCAQEQFAESIPHLKRATELNEDLQLHFEYANVLNAVNLLEESLQIYENLLRRNPECVAILYNTAYTLKRMNRIHDAMYYYNAVLERDPNHAEAQFSRGLAYIMMGEWDKGWEGYEWRWKRKGPQPLWSRVMKQPMWDGSDIRGKTVLLNSEQGHGDTFQFIRFAKQVKDMGAKKVLVSTQPNLKTIVSYCPYVDGIVDLTTQPLPDYDVHAPIPSLPRLLKTQVLDLPGPTPYIHANPLLVEEWRRKLSGDKNFKIGICWQGNNKYHTAFLRAVVACRPTALAALAPIGRIPNVSIYSLQKVDGLEQLQNLPEGFTVKTFDGDFDDSHGRFMDTAAVMKNLDLVITVDTSIAHLAGALGVPVWTMIPNPPDWRWMFDIDDTPWYPTMQLFRQETPGDWEPVIKQMVDKLVGKVATHQAQKGLR